MATQFLLRPLVDFVHEFGRNQCVVYHHTGRLVLVLRDLAEDFLCSALHIFIVVFLGNGRITRLFLVLPTALLLIGFELELGCTFFVAHSDCLVVISFPILVERLQECDLAHFDFGTEPHSLVFLPITHVLETKTHKSCGLDGPGLIQQDDTILNELVFVVEIVRESHRFYFVFKFEALEFEDQGAAHQFVLVGPLLQLLGQLGNPIDKLSVAMNRLKGAAHTHTPLPNNPLVVDLMQAAGDSERALNEEFVCPLSEGGVDFSGPLDQVFAVVDV